MIRRHTAVPTQSDMKARYQWETVCPWRRPTGRVAVAILLLGITMLACVGIRPVSQSGPRRIAVATHLPTLTPTPLPTLTPTANVTPVAVALSTESTAPVPEPSSSPVESERPVAPVAPGAVPMLPDNSTNGAPAAGVEPAVTDPNAPVEVAAVPPASPNTPAAVEAAPSASSPAPTMMATATLVPPTDTPMATATEPPTPTSIPTETPTPTVTPLPQGWVFSGVQGFPAETLQGFMFFGELLNNTGSPQQLTNIDATFFDAQGQAIAYDRAINQWPVREVSPGGRVPFGVIVPNIQGVTDYDFQVQSEPGSRIPREDFEFLEVNQTTEEEDYCITGRLRNPGDQLKTYLMIAAILYDGEDQVINYNNAFQVSPTNVVGDQTTDIDICVDSRQDEVARYELRAWGL